MYYGTPLANATVSTSAASYTLSNIPQTHKHLLVICTGRTDHNQFGPQFRIHYNGAATAAGSTYWSGHLLVNSGISGQTYGAEDFIRQRWTTRLDIPAGMYSTYMMLFPNYTSTTLPKQMLSWYVATSGAQASAPYEANTLGNGANADCINTNDALTSLKFFNSDGNYVAGNFISIYGVN